MLARTAMEKVLVVGSGITGAVVTSLLRHKLPENSQIQVWEKSRGAGGRMSTARSQKENVSSVDLGAQYISALPPDYSSHSRFYGELQHADLLNPLKYDIENSPGYPEGTQHFVAPQGISSLAKYFLNQSGAEVKFAKHLSKLELADGKWNAITDSGDVASFDCVLLTMPAPQVLQLQGDVPKILDSQPDVRQKLSATVYSCRFAMGLFYAPGTQLDLPWVVKYVREDPCICFVAVDNQKRNVCDDSRGPSLLVHTSVPFSLKHIEEDKEDICRNIVLPSLQKLFPNLPEPVEVKSHKWRYSQVYKPYEGTPGAVLLNENPPLVAAGDIFTKSSGFDRCLESALKATDIVMNSSAAKL